MSLINEATCDTLEAPQRRFKCTKEISITQLTNMHYLKGHTTAQRDVFTQNVVKKKKEKAKIHSSQQKQSQINACAENVIKLVINHTE